MKRSSRRGFTMIELALSLAFISVLLLTATLIIINITAIYQKGLSLRAIESTGRELIDEFSRSISSAPTIDMKTYCTRYSGNTRTTCENDNGFKFSYRQVNGTVKYKNRFGTDQTIPVALHGAFCTGRYSYIWNTGYSLASDQNASVDEHPYTIITVAGSGDDLGNARAKYKNNQNFRLLKISDPNRAICSEHVNEDAYTDDAGNTYTDIGAAEELISSSEANLALFDVDFFKPTQHQVTLHSFYSGTFILATLYGPVDITGSGEFCTEPADGLGTDFAYCAINKFNFAMRSEGRSN